MCNEAANLHEALLSVSGGASDWWLGGLPETVEEMAESQRSRAGGELPAHTPTIRSMKLIGRGP